MDIKKYVPFVAVAVVAGGLGFYGGMTHGKNMRLMRPGGPFGADRAGGNMGGMTVTTGPGGNRVFRSAMPGSMGVTGNAVIGEVLSKDDRSITVKLPDGGSKIVFTAESTKVSKPTDVSLNDVEVGQSVVVAGRANDDGSMTAESIQVRTGAPVLAEPAKR